MNDINFDYEKTSIEQTIDKIEKIKNDTKYSEETKEFLEKTANELRRCNLMLQNLVWVLEWED